MEVNLWVWVAFSSFIILLLIIDLKLVMRKPHRVKTREAAIYSAIWIGLGLAFGGFIWWWQGIFPATQYITAYLIEKSLSIDNVFLWAVLFSYFKVRPEYQHKILFWGIFGALVMRAGFIYGGVSLMRSVHWVIYIFGAFLIYTAYRIWDESSEVDPAQNPILRFVNKFVRQTDRYYKDNFFVKINGRTVATPMLTVLIVVELTDLVFAVDSIPAVLAISQDIFIIFSSNAFAILGLRALYFLVADLKESIRYLNKGLAVVLGFVGVKFVLSDWVHVPSGLSLGVIVGVMTITVLLSNRAVKREAAEIRKKEH